MSWQTIYKSPFFRLCLIVLIALIAIILSYNFFDKNIALAVSQLLQAYVSPKMVSWFAGYKKIIGTIVQSDDYVNYVAEIAIVLCLLAPFKVKRFKFTQGLAITSISIILTYQFKVILKAFFGRCCAKAASDSALILNSILFDRNAMFFHYFHGHANMGLFPSGHMSIMACLLTSLCIYLPRLTVVWILFGLLMAASLIFTNNHFFSDVVSGALLGILTSYCTYRMFGGRKEVCPS